MKKIIFLFAMFGLFVSSNVLASEIVSTNDLLRDIPVEEMSINILSPEAGSSIIIGDTIKLYANISSGPSIIETEITPANKTLVLVGRVFFLDNQKEFSYKIGEIKCTEGNKCLIGNWDTTKVKLGKYKIVVSDIDGKYKTEIEVSIVPVPDTTKPTITLIGDDSVTIYRNGSYTEKGVIVSDDTTPTDQILLGISSNVDTSTIGTYVITYFATDKAGNTASITRTVNVIDRKPLPELSVKIISPEKREITRGVPVELIVSISSEPSITSVDITPRIKPLTLIGKAFLLNSENKELPYFIGKVECTETDKCLIGTWDTKEVKEGKYEIVVSDADGKYKTSVVITIVPIVVYDTTPPVITINSYTTTPTNQNITVTATTNEGILNYTSHLFTENGSFDFVAIDEAGNKTTKTVTITNIDKVAPVFGTYTNTVNVFRNESYQDVKPTANDNVDGEVAVISSGSVNTSTIGVYTITYTATDSAGNQSTATRTVNVIRRPSSGGGSSGSILPITTTITNPQVGQVLGAEKFIFTLLLKLGSRGNEVIELQKKLIADGYLKITAPTGYFGPLTLKAVKEFQTAKLLVADGIVGPLTRAELNK